MSNQLSGHLWPRQADTSDSPSERAVPIWVVWTVSSELSWAALPDTPFCVGFQTSFTFSYSSFKAFLYTSVHFIPPALV